jgi:hypothetical protein
VITRLLTGNAKAVIAAAIAFLGGIQVGLDGRLTAAEVVGSIIAGLVALGGVYIVPNLGQASPQAVVDAVKAVVPLDVAAQIDEAVTPIGRGLLRTVTGR